MLFRSRQEELTQLGLLSLLPFAMGVIAVWALPQHLALDAHRIILGYAAIIAAYLAGVGAGGILGGAKESGEPLLPSMVVAVLAWAVLWIATGSTFYLEPVWRYFLIIGVLLYLLLRDLRAVDRRQLPAWYGPLRIRLSFWAISALALITARLALWGLF